MPPVATGRRYDVVVVDNVDAVRNALVSLPATHPATVASVRSFASIDELDLNTPPPDVVILDLWLDRDSALSTPHVPRLRKWGARVLIYTTEERPHPLQQALAAGADGLSLKNDGVDALVSAIAQVASGQRGLSSPLARALLEHSSLKASLTPTEIQTLRALSYGKSPEEIAQRRHVAASTVRTHIESIRRKYAETAKVRVSQTRMIAEGTVDGYVDPRFRHSEDLEIT